MPDIDINYDSITQVASLLSNAELNISPQISNLHTQVDALLSPDTTGGLWMSQTSPAIQAQYEQFNTAAVQCCQAITSFSQMFNTLVTNLQSMDGSMAYNVSHPTSS
jgi:hypothetical protein